MPCGRNNGVYSLSSSPNIQFFNGENQVPVFAPYHISIINDECSEQLWIKVLVVLGMRMPTNKPAYVNNALVPIVESQFQAQFTLLYCRYNIYTLHSYIFLLILVVLTTFLHYKEIYPLINNALPILVNKLLSNFCIVIIKRYGSMFLPSMNVFQFSLLDNQVKDAFRTTMLYMNIYWLMVV